MNSNFTLSGHTALITGGSRGIGAAIAKAYAGAGAAVVVNYLSRADEARAVVEDIKQAGGRAAAVQADVGDLVQQERLLAGAEAAFGPVGILVNNAGVEERKDILDYTPGDWDWHINTNLKGAFFLAQRVARRMVEKGLQGRIINISSTHETRAMPRNAIYSISKAGLAMMTKSLALELGPRGICVNSLIPGAIRTDMNSAVLADPAYEAKVKAKIPLGWIAEPQDCVAAALLLAGDGGRYINGSTITVDGGLLL
jgi:glucose 1-dehydrogenase